MSASRREILLGLALAALMGVLLPWVISDEADQSDLFVDLPGQTFSPEISGVALVGLATEPRVGPPDVARRLEQPGSTPDRPGSGPGLLVWRVVYGSRWTREVQLPIFPEGQPPRDGPGPCAFGLVLRPGLLDDGESGGGDLVTQIEQRIAALFPITVSGPVRVEFPRAAHVAVSLQLEQGATRATATVDLDDGTRFRVTARFALESRGGRLLPLAKEVRLLEWSGPSRKNLGGWVGGLARALLGKREFDELVDAHAEPILRQQIVKQLQPLRLPGPRAWFPGRPDDKIGVRLCGEPRLLPDGIYLPLALDIELHPWRSFLAPTAVPGPRPLSWPSQPSPGARLELVASSAGVGQLLDLAWQAGQIPDLGPDSAPVAQIREELSGRFNFEVDRVVLSLPPALDQSPPEPTPGSWPVRVMGIQLGALPDERRIIAHADIALEPRVDAQGVTFVGRLQRLHLSCATGRAGGTRLSPCLSDVIPLARERLVGRAAEWPLGAELLERASTSSLGGYTLQLHRLRGGVAPGGVGLHLTAGAKIHASRP